MRDLKWRDLYKDDDVRFNEVALRAKMIDATAVAHIAFLYSYMALLNVKKHEGRTGILDADVRKGYDVLQFAHKKHATLDSGMRLLHESRPWILKGYYFQVVYARVQVNSGSYCAEKEWLQRMASVLQRSLEFYTLDEISSADKEAVAAFCEEHIRKIKNGQSEDVTKRNAEIILRKHIADVRGEHACPICGNLAVLQCTRCKSVRYCEEKCQREHWPRHKSVCAAVVSAATPS